MRGRASFNAAALHEMGGVLFAVQQLKMASAASTRRAWLAVVLDAVVAMGDVGNDGNVLEVFLLVLFHLFTYLWTCTCPACIG